MFLHYNNTVYEITRESAKEDLKHSIRLKLKEVYNKFLLEDVVEEIMNNISFSEAMGNNSVYICDNGRFREFSLDNGVVPTGKVYLANDFAPIYNGEKVCEITQLLQYTIAEVIGTHKGVKNALIRPHMQGACKVVSIESEIQKALRKTFTKSYSDSIAAGIAHKIANEDLNMFMVLIEQKDNNSFYYRDTYYSIERDFKRKKTKAFEVDELKKTLMQYFPELKVLSKHVDETANLIHNLITFGKYECESELISYTNGVIKVKDAKKVI